MRGFIRDTATRRGVRGTVPAVAVLAVLLGGMFGAAGPVGNVNGTAPAAGEWSGPAALSPSSADTGVERTLAATSQSPTAGEARIVELYPNPVTTGDRGEFVTVAFPSGANLTEYELADGHAAVSLSPRARNRSDTNVTESVVDTDSPPDRTITFSTDSGLTAWLTDRTVAPLSRDLQLANDGDTVRLRYEGAVVDEVGYGRATEADVYNATAGRWEPLGATDRPVVTAQGGTVEAFVLPDEPDRAVEFLESAEERVLLAGYTVSSPAVVEALTATLQRGVEVEVLAEGSPAGGMTGDGAAALSELDRAGAAVRVLDGDRARYRYHHAKYAVVDDRALVTTENWKPAGTGGMASRGWAVITDQEPVVTGLAETFRADAGGMDTVPWREYDPALVEGDPATGGHPQVFEARQLPVERTRLLVAPDNAEPAVRTLVEGAEESIDIKQVSIGDRGFPLLQAAIDAAERGVEVRILLSGAWYVRDENEQLVAWLTDQATAADLPLSARVAEPGDAFEKIHAKGVVVDGDEVLVGSVNWNNNSLRNNREVALLLSGDAVGDYFGGVFEADWRGEGEGDGGQALPLGIALAVLAGAVVAILGTKQIRFD